MGNDVIATMPADEELASERHYPYFRELLLSWRKEIEDEAAQTVASMRQGEESSADVVDRAASEADRGILLRTRDRQRKLMARIDAALRRIEDGSYGICVETGEAMPVARLRARPVATLCVEAQERRERGQRAARS